jgi:hypothetical protein
MNASWIELVRADVQRLAAAKALVVVARRAELECLEISFSDTYPSR